MQDFNQIENKWKTKWNEWKLYDTPKNPKRKFYLLEMFAYPSGDIHIGHFRNYALGDLIYRYKRMMGFDILHPFGWDAFGLPAEGAAIKRGISPQKWTEGNIANARETLQNLGISYDWNREIATCRPDYYKWTQWIFLQLYKKGLVYQSNSFVNWCPKCQTVLANEQIIGGKCWRCSSAVEKRKLKQWYFKITDYAQRLLDDIDKLTEWPENIRTMQKNWIGRSEGSEIVFQLENNSEIKLPVFTTRPDTTFGVTFLVIAPDHELIEKILPLSPNGDKLQKYIDESLKKTEIERTFVDRPKEGVSTGLFVINPVNGEKVTLWVGDYVLASYGTGIVMGVPAHDQRDFEFAHKKNLPIKIVIKPSDRELKVWEMTEAYVDDGIMINSGKYNGMDSVDGGKALTKDLERCRNGGFKVTFKLRDWLVSRQRYWGAPIPIVHCSKCGVVPVPENDLPVLLPSEDKVDFIPKGRSPLEDVPEFLNTTCPKCGGKAKRDVDTMDTFVCSSWYHLRYIDPENDNQPFTKENANTWLPIDFYIGGAEHATGHLLYFRFVTKVLYDLGYISVDEPAVKLFNQGMVLDDKGDVMSKSKGNVISPRDVIDKMGTDGLRISMFFFAPPEREILWSDKATKGSIRFLDRIRAYFINELETNPENVSQENETKILKALHRLIKKVRDDIENLQLNTAIAGMMTFLNEYEPLKNTLSVTFKREITDIFTRLIAPFTPYIAEEMWENLEHSDSVFLASYPDYELSLTKLDSMTLPIQVNGKLRATLDVSRDISKGDAIELAKYDSRIVRYLEDADIVKIIWVPKRLLNFVVRQR